MISDGAHDPMLRYLALLPPLSPDSTRAERVRARCRAQLARNRRSERPATIVGFAQCILAPVVVGSLCVLYIARLVGTALRLHSMFD
jgi:hypothetical protein